MAWQYFSVVYCIIWIFCCLSKDDRVCVLGVSLLSFHSFQAANVFSRTLRSVWIFVGEIVWFGFFSPLFLKFSLNCSCVPKLRDWNWRAFALWMQKCTLKTRGLLPDLGLMYNCKFNASSLVLFNFLWWKRDL